MGTKDELVDAYVAKARIKDLVRQAMRLNAEGVKRVARKSTAPKKPLRVPRDLASISSGSPRPDRRPPGPGDSRRPSTGSRRVNAATGSTCSAEAP